jgi:hypothetical protein
LREVTIPSEFAISTEVAEEDYCCQGTLEANCGVSSGSVGNNNQGCTDETIRDRMSTIAQGLDDKRRKKISSMKKRSDAKRKLPAHLKASPYAVNWLQEDQLSAKYANDSEARPRMSARSSSDVATPEQSAPTRFVCYIRHPHI